MFGHTAFWALPCVESAYTLDYGNFAGLFYFGLSFGLIKGPVGDFSTVPKFEVTVLSLGFLLALMGWMPIPLDASVWHSFWALAFKKA